MGAVNTDFLVLGAVHTEFPILNDVITVFLGAVSWVQCTRKFLY